MSWDDVKALLKAGLNPRFCTSEKAAVDLLTDGDSVDCLSFMGGFSHVVYKAWFSQAGGVGTKKPIDMGIELAATKYVEKRTRENWEALSLAVDQGTTKDGKAFTNEQKAAIAKTIHRGLVKFFNDLSFGKNEVWLAFIKAGDMVAYDIESYGGGFGKSGSQRLTPDRFFEIIMHSVGQKKNQGKNSPNVPEHLVRGFVEVAQRYGATLGW